MCIRDRIIIEHREQNTKTWTVYEHISGIRVNAGDEVRPDRPIARFMNTDELNKYGWKFDHLHFEVMKMPPVKLKPLAANPQRFFNSYGLVCYSEKDLEEHYYDPLRFLSEHFK